MSERIFNDSGIEIKSEYIGGTERAGEFPYTRAIRKEQYRGKLWTMRQYAGFSTAEESNKRYHYLLNKGTTGLSVAFDLPTQIGYDSDHAMSMGEVGKVGVAIDSLKDMQILFDGIKLEDITTSMTINATASTLLAMYIALAKQQGADLKKISGTIQNDILKEYIARGTYIYPPKPSMRIITDIFEYCSKEVPKWNTISISGYHIREAGSTAIQELAFTLANGKTYVKSAIEKGLDINVFGKRLSFFFNAHNDFFQEVAKFRAARRMWAQIMKEMGATDPHAMMLRFHTQTGGSTLTAQQPENNIIRVAIQAMSAVCGGTQSLHTNGYDEALSLPTEKAAALALRTQQIIAHESGAALTDDPLGGSYYIEELTNQIETEAAKLIANIEHMGGAISAIEQGFMQQEIANSAYKYQKAIESGAKVIVGVNNFIEEEHRTETILKIDDSIRQSQAAKLEHLKNNRDKAKTALLLSEVENAAKENRNLMPYIIEAVEGLATLGEISDRLRKIFGEHKG
ncbi:MAG: methylmalonyl-CoA mutase family protein [Bacteroidia bacterium]|nr:methylmalonyl-CoA mutase [Bacteroidia bacterium]MCO5253509.1 methylmalonyl-CoA mutase family protein [Bacteroidota bacterium]MCZ2131517.1 methylmalonyl-CoA mutase family protein [Bacteroidia bacterium]